MPTTMLHRFTAFLLTLLMLVAMTGPAVAASKPPNVVLVLVDDLGWMDLGCQGSKLFETPRIDAVAAEGMRFTDGYAACAVCSPTRAAVQTGRYPGRLYITDWIRSRFQGGKIPDDKVNPCLKPKSEWRGREVLCPPNALWMESDEVTIAEALKPAGYRSCYIGKWHLGADPWYPTEQGYDVNIGGCDYGQPPNYFDPFNQPKGRHPMLCAGIPFMPGKQKGQYLSDREADEAEGFIRDHFKRHSGKPFFLMLANYAVHTPIQAKKDVTDKYAAKLKGMKNPAQKNAKYAAMVQSVDDAVGKVIDTLKSLKQYDNTVIIFTSDNGGLMGPTNNAPLRSGKGYAFEGGIRVPFIVRWPGVTKPGSTSDVPVTSVDLFPTIVQGVGQKLPGDREIDGLDLKPVLSGKGKLGRDAIYWHFPHYRHKPGPYSIIRDGDFKLIKWYEGPKLLFNLKDDLSESNDLASAQPQRVKQLEDKLMGHLKQINAKIPFPKPGK